MTRESTPLIREKTRFMNDSSIIEPLARPAGSNTISSIMIPYHQYTSIENIIRITLFILKLLTLVCLMHQVKKLSVGAHF